MNSNKSLLLSLLSFSAISAVDYGFAPTPDTDQTKPAAVHVHVSQNQGGLPNADTRNGNENMDAFAEMRKALKDPSAKQIKNELDSLKTRSIVKILGLNTVIPATAGLVTWLTIKKNSTKSDEDKLITSFVVAGIALAGSSILTTILNSADSISTWKKVVNIVRENREERKSSTIEKLVSLLNMKPEDAEANLKTLETIIDRYYLKIEKLDEISV